MPVKNKRTVERLFITVGTTKFDSLVEHVTSDEFIQISRALNINYITLQAGQSIRLCDPEECKRRFIDAGIRLHIYDYKPNLDGDIRAATLIVSHAGAGTCLEVLRLRKLLIVVTNTDLMDNHQQELADKLCTERYLTKCGVNNLDARLQSLILDSRVQKQLRSFPQQDKTKFRIFFCQVLQKAGLQI